MGDVSLSVIIPFYQRKPGLLIRAVRSALTQKDFDDFDIIVVDDGSPRAASDELAPLLQHYPEKLSVILQENLGPGMARNRGLDHLPKTRKYVAFLDSDDTWTPDHLKNALSVLHRGYDFYFSNLYHVGRNISAFDREQKIKFPNRLRPHEMTALEGLPEKYEFTGDMFDRILFSGNILLPPTVVYDFQKFPNQRFQPDYHYMGEDYLFFADIALANPRYGFSWTPEVHCGRGVNIFVNSGWGSQHYLDRLCDEMRFRRYAENTYSLTPEQKDKNNQVIRRIREDFKKGLLSHLKRGQFHKLAKIPKMQKSDGHFYKSFSGQ
ncbi:glycosyltransferase [Paremcibacter congregatus]|uniref:glycosyltransferase n=1 Tax=Paremcibacter congregatus TaxID=2043170 RepID=UPI0030ED86B6|tara:strand:+ start:14204 stop:15169 length:966 start_codon:yes stop_codon:yes gene_type:complete